MKEFEHVVLLDSVEEFRRCILSEIPMQRWKGEVREDLIMCGVVGYYDGKPAIVKRCA